MCLKISCSEYYFVSLAHTPLQRKYCKAVTSEIKYVSLPTDLKDRWSVKSSGCSQWCRSWTAWSDDGAGSHLSADDSVSRSLRSGKKQKLTSNIQVYQKLKCMNLAALQGLRPIIRSTMLLPMYCKLCNPIVCSTGVFINCVQAERGLSH